MENWRIIEIKGFEDVYQVSDLGRVRRIRDNKVMALKKTHTGYLHIGLRKGGKRKWCPVHRLVAIMFLDNLEKKPQVNHKNGCKDDNRVYNLEWCTQSENIKHAYANNLWCPVNRKAIYNVQERKSYASSFQAAQWLNNTKFGNKRIIKNLARDIRTCASGDQKTAHGYIWKFIV